MAQRTLIQTPVALFATVGGKTEERGNCACAIVGVNSSPPRFTLVCYNEQRQTLAAASITSNNEQSLRFQMQSNEYANFVDNQGSSWSIMFLRSADVDLFCANLGVACYGAAGKPTHNASLCDMAHPTQRNKKTLKLGERAKVRFAAFEVEPGASATDAPRVARILGTNGDIPYNFSAVQSAYSILQDGKGFESSVVDMAEGSVRVVVLPASVPRSCGNIYGSASIVFVIHLNRIIVDDVPLIQDVGTHPPAVDDKSADANSGALVVAQLDLANASPSAASTTTKKGEPPAKFSAMDPTYSGIGVPVEHMAILQKVSAQMNSTMTQIRDLEDKVGNFQEEWKQTVNKPKPSVMTAQTLEQNVKQLILDNERIKDEISRRDELIRSIEERNRDLQKRMDKAAEMAQNLLDEKQNTVSNTGDLKLEQDRQVMKLQEQITKVSTERDDIGRHLQTVKKMLDMSDSDLRDIKGKCEVFNVQVQALNNKHDAVEDQFGEERSRRKALEAKAASVNEEIRQNAADLHMKKAQSQDLERKTESDRLHYVQLMEDERQRRAMDTQQLRSEILTELQTREERFQADRARVMEDNHSRGRDEGKEIGKKNAAIDLQEKLEALKLEAQRSKTELDANKTLVKTGQEEAMSENRRLEAIVSGLKNSADQETRRKAQGEFKLQTSRSKVRSVEDTLFIQITNCAHRLRRPVPPADALALLTAVKEGNNPDFTFQQEQHDAEVQESINRRIIWIAEEMETQYTTRQTSLFHQTYVPETNELFEELTATIARLWKERDEALFGSVFSEQEELREEIAKEEDSDFEAILSFYSSMIEEQKKIVDEEETARAEIDQESEPFFEQLEEYSRGQREERENLCEEEEKARREIEEEEAPVLDEYSKELEAKLFEKIIAEQQEVVTEEEEARQKLEDEVWAMEGTLQEQYNESEEEAKSRQSFREGQEEEQASLLKEEETARAEVEAEFDSEQQELDTTEESERKAQLDKEEEEREEQRRKEEEEKAEQLRKEEEERAEQQRKEEEERAEQQRKEEEERQREEEERKREEKEKKKTETEAALKATPGPLDMGEDAPAIAVATDSSSSDSDDDGLRTRASKGKAPPKKSAPKPSDGKKKPAPAAKLWGSDSDDDSEKESAPAPVPKKRAPAKKAAAAKLFESDDDE